MWYGREVVGVGEVNDSGDDLYISSAGPLLYAKKVNLGGKLF